MPASSARRKPSAVELGWAVALCSPSSVRAQPQFRAPSGAKRMVTGLMHDIVEEMASSAILHLNDPNVRIEPRFTTKVRFYICLEGRQSL
jgi:hypothetical protein